MEGRGFTGYGNSPHTVILSIDSLVDAHDRRKLLPRGEPEQGNLGIVPIAESPARAQFSSRGQRPRNSLV